MNLFKKKFEDIKDKVPGFTEHYLTLVADIKQYTLKCNDDEKSSILS